MHTALYAVLVTGLGLSFSALADKPAGDNQIENIVVTGKQIDRDKLEQELALTPGGVTLVDSAELYQRNISSMADMLRYVPGIWASSSTGGDTMYFSSRGSNLDATDYDMNGIKLMQDGLPVTTADGNNHNRMIDPLSASHAVVARGANALAYGASTLGGAIDFVSPTARDTGSELFINGGSDGHRQGRLTASAAGEALDGLITLEAKHRDGYRQHSEQNRSGLYANAGWKISDAVQTRLYLTYIDNEEELPGPLTVEQFSEDPYQAEPAAVTGHYQVNVDSWRIANKTDWDIDDRSNASFGVSYEEQSLYHPIVDKVMVDFGSGPVEVFSLLIDTDQANVGSSLRYNLDLGQHDLLFGINYGHTTVNGGEYRNDGGQRSELTTLVDTKAQSTEAFFLDRWQIAQSLKLIYGAQFVATQRDVINIDVASNTRRNPKANYNSVNPRIGLIYQTAAEAEWFVNLSRLYEAPTNYELQDDIRGNDATLNAMRGSVLELGTRGSGSWGDSNQWGWELAIYYAQLRDEILSVDDPDAPGTSLSTNLDDTLHAGVEALFMASMALDTLARHRVEPKISVTVNEFSFADDPVYGNNILPAAPRYAVKGEVLYRYNNGFFIGPTFDFIGKRYADFSNTHSVDSYALLGLRAGLSGNRWEAFADIRNLNNKAYAATHSVKDIVAANDALLFAGEPRSVYVGLTLRF